MPLFTDLIELGLINLHSLQFGKDAEQLDPWSNLDGITDWHTVLNDFSDTAFVVRQLDLVISVDTAVAHLAGALNRPTWLLLPQNADFRWLKEDLIVPGIHQCACSDKVTTAIGQVLFSSLKMHFRSLPYSFSTLATNLQFNRDFIFSTPQR